MYNKTSVRKIKEDSKNDRFNVVKMQILKLNTIHVNIRAPMDHFYNLTS